MKYYLFLLSVFIFIGCALFGCAAADVQISNQGYDELVDGDIASAEESFIEALKINPHNLFAKNNLGVVYLNSGRIEQARQMFLEVIEADNSSTPKRVTNDEFSDNSIVDIARYNLELIK